MTSSPAGSLADNSQTALQHHHASRLAEAEGLYRRNLESQPENSGTLHLLSVIAHQRAIALRPSAVEYRDNRDEAYRARFRGSLTWH